MTGMSMVPAEIYHDYLRLSRKCMGEGIHQKVSFHVKYVQGRLQVRASEMGKTGTNIACPVLDKRKGRRDTPHTSHCSLREISSEPVKGEIPTAL